MAKKILLINTLARLDYWEITNEPPICMPAGILSIGTVLKEKGFEVVLIDPMVDKNYLNSIEENLKDCLFAGLSVMTAGVASALSISEFIRKKDSHLPIVWGGIHPTLFPEQTLEDSRVDVIVWGEGEETCLELANVLGRGEGLSEVKGIGFKSDGRIFQTPRRNFIDINALPENNYDLLNINKYIYRDLNAIGYFGTFGPQRVKIFILNASRGCPYKCTFCINTHPSQKYRAKPSQRLLREIESAVNKYDPDIIYLQDDLFFANKQRVFAFFQEYKEKNYRFKWISLTRVNYFCREYLSDDYLKQIKDSCLWLGMGIESGSVKIRELLKKEVSDEDIMRGVTMLSKYDIPANYAFMVGLPFESKNEMYQTISIIKKIKKMHPQAEFSYLYYRPYPGGELYEEALRSGYQPPQTLEGWVSFQDVESGFASLESLPWIKNVSFIKYLLFAVPHSTRNIRKQKLLTMSASFLTKSFFRVSLYIRTWFGWEGLLLELKLWNLARQIRQSLRKIRISRGRAAGD